MEVEITATKESPMETMSRTILKIKKQNQNQNNNNNKNSLTGKLQIEIQCSYQKNSAIINRPKPRKGEKNNWNNQQQKSRNLTTNIQLNLYLE